MKTTYLCICVLGLSLAACTTHVTTGDGSNKVEEKGVMTSDQRQLADFNRIEIDGVFNVILSQGEQASLTIDADEAIAKHIITEVNGNRLLLKMEDNTDFGDLDPVTIHIHVKQLSSLSTTGVGKVSSEAILHLDTFNLSCHGVGAIDLKLEANQLIVHSETVGAITLAGKVQHADITHNGVGILQAFELLTQDLKLSSEGVGAAEVYASASIDIHAKGVGSVQYKGNPKTKKINSEGIGKVEAVE